MHIAYMGDGWRLSWYLDHGWWLTAGAYTLQTWGLGVGWQLDPGGNWYPDGDTADEGVGLDND